MSGPSPSKHPWPATLRGEISWATLQAAIGALWLFVIPALLAGLTLKLLVPPSGSAFRGWVAHTGQAYPVPFLATMFLFFSALAHYWRFYIPGGRHASALPAHVVIGERDPERLRAWAELVGSYEAFISPGLRRRLTREACEGVLATYEKNVAALRSAIVIGDEEGARSAVRAIAPIAGPLRDARARSQLVITGVALAATVAAAVMLRTRVSEDYQVLGGSMIPTLEPADRIAVNRLAYGGPSAPRVPDRGDVITFRSNAVDHGPTQVPDILVKRVIGLPGDRIEMPGGSPVINGWKVPWCDAGRYIYLAPDNTLDGHVLVEFLADRAYLTVHTTAPTAPMERPYVVRPGEVFVLGDNRVSSLDSRSWNQGRGGGVPVGAIEGRAQWFLVGTHRGGEADFSRFLREIDGGDRSPRMEGVDATALAKGIARCMHDRPKDTLPPAPNGDGHAGT